MEIESIFAEALRFASPAERSSYLQRACGEDVTKRRELEELLTAYVQSEGFLDVPLVQRTALERGDFCDETRKTQQLISEAMKCSTGEAGDAAPSAKYQIVEEVARGGMGIVFRVREESLGRDLAMKVLRSEHRGNASLIRRFVREAQITGQLQHPGIPSLIELDQLSDGRPFFTMKLVRGQTLSQLLVESGQNVSHRRLLEIFHSVCQIVAYAHGQGVIHRDLKPANVMVGAFGEVQVMDWGLAKVLSSEAETILLSNAGGSEVNPPLDSRNATASSETPWFHSETQAGHILGTPAYVAPEQASGQTDRLDRRTDVFGLGAILVEILTGEPPYAGPQILEVLAQAKRADLSDANRRLAACDADPELVKLARSCLAAHPNDRPADAGEVAATVERYFSSVSAKLEQARLDKAQADARAEEALARVHLERRGKRMAVLCLAVIVCCGSLLGWIWQERQTREAESARQRTVEFNDLWMKANSLREKAAQLPAPESTAARAQARTHLEHAQRLLEEYDSEDVRVPRVKRALTELDQETKDRELLARLGVIRTMVLEDLSPSELRQKIHQQYEQAFAVYGIAPKNMTAEKSGSFLQQRPQSAQDQIIAGLDHWRLVTSNQPSLRETSEWLFAMLDSLDRNAWRRSVRNALVNRDLDQLERLSQSVDVSTQPPATIQLLATSLTHLAAAESRVETLKQAIGLLEESRTKDPDDLGLNLELVTTLLGLVRDPMGTTKSYKPWEIREPLEQWAVRQKEWKADFPIYTRKLLQYATAISVLQPRNATAHAFLAQAYEWNNDAESAETEYRRALQLEEDSHAATFGLVSLLFRLDRFDEAVDQAKAALKRHPEWWDLAAATGRAFFEKRDFVRAEEILAAAVQSSPRNAILRLHHAETLLGLRQREKSIAALQTVLRLAESEPWDERYTYPLKTPRNQLTVRGKGPILVVARSMMAQAQRQQAQQTAP